MTGISAAAPGRAGALPVAAFLVPVLAAHPQRRAASPSSAVRRTRIRGG